MVFGDAKYSYITLVAARAYLVSKYINLKYVTFMNACCNLVVLCYLDSAITNVEALHEVAIV